MDKPKLPRKDVTVVIPRALWRRLKYEAWLRQATVKSMLAEALEHALERWKSEHERAS